MDPAPSSNNAADSLRGSPLRRVANALRDPTEAKGKILNEDQLIAAVSDFHDM